MRILCEEGRERNKSGNMYRSQSLLCRRRRRRTRDIFSKKQIQLGFHVFFQFEYVYSSSPMEMIACARAKRRGERCFAGAVCYS